MGLFGRSKKPRETYRCFFATDIHGSDRCFRKFLAAATTYEANALILGGDIAGKAIVPIVDNGDGTHRIEFLGRVEDVAEADVEEIVGRIKFNGLYPHRCDAAEHERLAADPAHREALFEQTIVDQVRGWKALADERLADEVRCIITPGNDDPLGIDAALEEPGRTECPEREAAPVGPFQLCSLGNTNRTPWDTEREFDEPELATQIDEMVESAEPGVPLVFNFHCPPFDSSLDIVNKLDAEFRPVIEHGAPVEVPVGSTAVRAAIEKYEPVVALHGHIHESHGVQRIGASICINPGSEYGTGYLKGAIVDFGPEGEYVGHLLTSG